MIDFYQSALAGAIKAVLDTTLLSEDGNLTPESEKMIVDTQTAIVAPD